MEASATASTGSIVAIGASAGGIEALSTLIGTLQRGFPAPIVIAQHLEPHRVSALATLFGRRTELDVVLIEGSMALEAGRIYVVPSGHHALLEPGRVRLEPGVGHPQPSIDRLFASAAKAYGERAIGVILSGSGSDGVAGALEIKQQGGTVVIQNPATARFPAMVLALPPTAVDYESDVERLGPLLHELLVSVRPEDAPEEEGPFTRVLATLTRRTGVDFSLYKRGTLMRRIGRRMAITFNPRINDYADYLERQRGEAEELLRSILIRVTSFFRDADAFALLRETVLPELIARGRERGNELRIWSAGCSTGEEAYSIVLLVADLLGDSMREWNVKVFATDLEENAIQFARRGVYPATVLEHLPAGYLGRFFEPTDAGYRVAKPLRQLVVFGQQDLTRGVPFPRIDLATCRNLLIYLKPELQQSVLDLFAYSLRPTGGYLFLGKAETVQPSRAEFELVDKRWKVYRCRADAAPAAMRPRSYAAVLEAQPHPQRASTPAREVHHELDAMQLKRFGESILKAMPCGVVLLDPGYRILVMNTAARRLLGVRDLVADQDFLHAARGLPYKEIRALIDQVRCDHGSATLQQVQLGDTGAPEPVHVSISAASVQQDPPDGAWLVLLSITDVSMEVACRGQLEAIRGEQDQLALELGEANRRYTALNHELQQSNEALQSSNEEMMLAHEELQAINEEFEATNEELQATNEELETSNEELQATNEELQATNEELNARSAELHRTSQAVADERRRLAEMVALAPFALLVMRGPELRVEHANDSFERMIGTGDLLGRPIEELAAIDPLKRLAEFARACYRGDPTGAEVTIEHVDADGSAHRIACRAAASRADDGAIDGVVLYGQELRVG